MVSDNQSKHSFMLFIAYLYRRIIVFQQFFYNIYKRLTKKRNYPMVFCIGFSKTGTTSLRKALLALGYRSIHWPRAHLKPKDGWIEYIRNSQYDAFSDAPIYFPGFYKKIDKSFPSSKFILTIRNPEELARSWKNYFRNAPWNINDEDDKKRLIREYNDHLNDVVEYFKEKPTQFLIFNIIGGEGWEKLCEFLEKPIPNTPFPHKRIAKYKKT